MQSQIVIPVSAGTTYYILAGGYSGYTGHLLIHLALTLPVDHFAWNTIPSPQSANVPFGVTVTAQDISNNPASNFTGTVGFEATEGSNSGALFVDGFESGNFSNWTIGSDAVTRIVTNGTAAVGNYCLRYQEGAAVIIKGFGMR